MSVPEGECIVLWPWLPYTQKFRTESQWDLLLLRLNFSCLSVPALSAVRIYRCDSCRVPLPIIDFQPKNLMICTMQSDAWSEETRAVVGMVRMALVVIGLQACLLRREGVSWLAQTRCQKRRDEGCRSVVSSGAVALSKAAIPQVLSVLCIQ